MPTLGWWSLGLALVGAASAVVTPSSALLPLLQAGVVVADVAEDELGARGLVAVDLGDDWVPRFLRDDPALGNVGIVPFAATYRALAAGELEEEAVGPRAKVDRFLDLRRSTRTSRYCGGASLMARSIAAAGAVGASTVALAGVVPGSAPANRRATSMMTVVGAGRMEGAVGAGSSRRRHDPDDDRTAKRPEVR